MSKLSWNDLFLSGSVVGLTTSVWGARLKLRPKDFGIEDSASVEQALSLGSTRLAPAESFKDIHEIVGKAKRAVDHYGLTFGFIFGTRYVPSGNLEKLSTRLKELRTEFDVAVNAFVADYDKTKEAMLPIVEQALKDAARTEEAAALAITRIRAEYPSAAEVRSKFGLIWSVYAIQGPKTAGAEAALASEGETVKGVIGFMVTQLREDVTTKLADVLALIQRGGVLRDASLRTAFEVLDRVEEVNVLGDVQLSNQVRQIRAVLRGIEAGKRVPDSTVAGLADIKAALEVGMEEAVATAERNLTAPGRRRIAA
jgi:hypothetical protein